MICNRGSFSRDIFLYIYNESLSLHNNNFKLTTNYSNYEKSFVFPFPNSHDFVRLYPKRSD